MSKTSKRGFKSARTVSKTDAQSSPGSSAELHPLPAVQLLQPNFRLIRDNLPAIFVMVGFPTLLAQLGIAMVGDGTRIDMTAAIGSLLSLYASAWLAFSIGATYYYQLQVMRGNRPGIIASYRHGLRFLPRIYGLGILVGLLTAGGLLLLIVPGLIVVRRYLLAAYYLVDEDLGIREAMQRSAADSKQYRRPIWETIGIIAAILIASSLPAILSPAYGRPFAAIALFSLTFMLVLRYQEIARKRPVGAEK